MITMNRILALTVAAVLVLGMLVTGCSPGETPTPTPSQSPVVTPTPTGSPSPSPDDNGNSNISSVTLSMGPGESPVVGKPAPNFRFTNPDGSTVNLRDLRGKPVMLNFWDIACVSCREEMPYLQQVYDNWTSKGLMFFSVDVGDGVNKVSGYVERNKLNFPVLVDNSGEVALGYGIWSFPMTILIDGQGVILVIKIGAFTSPQQIERDLLSQVFPELT